MAQPRKCQFHRHIASNAEKNSKKIYVHSILTKGLETHAIYPQSIALIRSRGSEEDNKNGQKQYRYA